MITLKRAVAGPFPLFLPNVSQMFVVYRKGAIKRCVGDGIPKGASEVVREHKECVGRKRCCHASLFTHTHILIIYIYNIRHPNLILLSFACFVLKGL